ncbi:Os07g0170049, partial [Oryza sativa Japonica Group]
PTRRAASRSTSPIELGASLVLGYTARPGLRRPACSLAAPWPRAPPWREDTAAADFDRTFSVNTRGAGAILCIRDIAPAVGFLRIDAAEWVTSARSPEPTAVGGDV